MVKAEFLKLEGESQKSVFQCWIDESGEFQFSGDEQILSMLKEEGIRDYGAKDGSRLFPSDGEKFIRNLPLAFRTAYLAATITENDR